MQNTKQEVTIVISLVINGGKSTKCIKSPKELMQQVGIKSLGHI